MLAAAVGDGPRGVTLAGQSGMGRFRIGQFLGDGNAGIKAVAQHHVEKHGKIVLSPKQFTDDTQVIAIIRRILAPIGRRIDETRSTGTDSNMLSGIERALSDIYSELRTLKPAEQLAGAVPPVW